MLEKEFKKQKFHKGMKAKVFYNSLSEQSQDPEYYLISGVDFETNKISLKNYFGDIYEYDFKYINIIKEKQNEHGKIFKRFKKKVDK